MWVRESRGGGGSPSSPRWSTTAMRTGDFTTPWRATPQVWEHYRHEADILRDLQQDWRTALAGAVYVAIEAGRATCSPTSSRRSAR